MDKKQIDEEKRIFEELKRPFDLSAYSIDSSRGFDLASLKAQYIPDRLNEVLGLTNWEFGGHFEDVINADKKTGVLFHGNLVIQIGERTKVIKSVGFSGNKKNEGDSRKGAMTDALSKAASHIGVADAAFKGLVNCEDIRQKNQVKVAKGGTKKNTGKVGEAPSFSKKSNKKDSNLGF